MKILVIIQARMGSTRLPGKVMLPLAGEPLLNRMLQRVAASSVPLDLVVATSVLPEDQPIRDVCQKVGVRCYNGHPTDLLDRHFQAIAGTAPDLVVKIPSDCPLIDPLVIDKVLSSAVDHAGAYDFVSNLHPPSYPDGNDVEVMTIDALETAWKEATRPYEREHTTPFIWDHPSRFRIRNVLWETGLDYSRSHRWTIDYPEDYRLIKAVYDELWTVAQPVFHLQDILDLLQHRPEIKSLNAAYAGETWYRHHLDELTTI
jgi:spore coat polysaccharide biosynthesis protein SpsF